MHISGASLVSVRLFLERDIAVGIAFHEQPHDPLYQVADVESYIEQFFHLLGMYRLVIDSGFRQRATLFAGEDNAEQVDRREPLERNDVVVDDLHSGNY
jgi:hypothetical protein